MIVWRGLGFVVLLCAAGGYWLAKAGAETMWESPLAGGHESVAILVGMLLAAALVFALDLVIKRHSTSRVMVDRETGQEVTLSAKHDFFFVPLKYWPFILVAVGLFAFLKS